MRVDNLNGITLTDILVLDEKYDTLVYANEAAASIELVDLLKGKLYFNTLAFATPDIRLNRPVPGSPLNIQFIIDNLSSDNKEKKETDLRINQLIIYDGKFKYDVLSEAHENGKFDPNHIEIKEFASNISLKNFNNENLNLYIRSIKGKEKSGLELQKLRTRVTARDNKMLLSDFGLELPGSNFASDTIVLTGTGDMKSMAFDGELHCERLTLEDMTPIFPELPTGLPEFRFDIRGHADSTLAKGNILIAATDGSLAVEGKARVTSPFDKRRGIEITLDRLTALESTIDKAAAFIGKAPQDIASILGNTDIEGKLYLSCDTIDGYANINSSNGLLQAKIVADSTGNYNLTAIGKAMHLGNILSQKELGTCNIKGKSRGNIKGKGILATLTLKYRSCISRITHTHRLS